MQVAERLDDYLDMLNPGQRRAAEYGRQGRHVEAAAGFHQDLEPRDVALVRHDGIDPFLDVDHQQGTLHGVRLTASGKGTPSEHRNAAIGRNPSSGGFQPPPRRCTHQARILRSKTVTCQARGNGDLNPNLA